MEVIDIRTERDVVRARQMARSLAEELGFSLVDKTRIATAVSELARNVFLHGGGGRMEYGVVSEGVKKGIRCVFIDTGPGIPDVNLALQDGFTTTTSGLGQGLPGAKRLMDGMTVESEPGKGTRVEVVTWKR